MASVAVCCGGVTYSVRQDWRNCRASSSRNASLTTMIGGGKKELMTPISISSASTTAESRTNRLETKRSKQRQEEAVSHENVIDEWMRHSVVEIVKSLREAPLLVQVYSDGDGNGRSTRLRTENAAPEEWLRMKREWENGTAPKPEGVIFVEQLREDEAVEAEDESEPASMDFGGASEVTRAWGIVVQGKGEENCGPACYLLKTSRVGAGAGLGLCCTHFCLVKVKSFSETAMAQFKNCWLLNGT